MNDYPESIPLPLIGNLDETEYRAGWFGFVSGQSLCEVASHPGDSAAVGWLDAMAAAVREKWTGK